MSDRDDKPAIKRLKTGAFSRRLQLSGASVRYGARALTQSARERFSDSDSPKARAQRQHNVDRFVAEIGKLKGSVVKVGQILATYGEYLLPPEVVEALHTLVDDTPPLQWKVMEKTLRRRLGEQRFAELDIDPKPLAAASMGQVHRATHRVTGEKLCIKVQYPGVAKTIDADLNAVIRLLRLARLLESTRAVDDWLRDVRELLHQEVDYRCEREHLEQARAALAGDPHYIVPRVYPEYSSDKLLTMSYEPGLPANSAAVAALSQGRRNVLGRALLRLFLTELYDWRSMQTDPNFGNYLVRTHESGHDQWVLLDFGAMRAIPDSFGQRFTAMIEASCRGDRAGFLDGAIALGFMKADFPAQVLEDFADIGMALTEPLKAGSSEVPAQALGGGGQYHWRDAELPKRIGKRAIQASLSRYFALPPKEFMYVMRKLMGVYAIVAALDAEFNGDELMAPYLSGDKR